MNRDPTVVSSVGIIDHDSNEVNHSSSPNLELQIMQNLLQISNRTLLVVTRKKGVVEHLHTKLYLYDYLESAHIRS